MRVLIVGVGGVGGYIASQLIRNTNAEITLLARGEHLKKIKEDGLQIFDDNNEYIVHPHRIVDDPQREGAFDLIIISVKSYDLEDILKKLSNNVTKETTIFPLLNGVDHDVTILHYYPNAKVLKGCIYIISHILKPGTIVKKGRLFKLCWGDPKASLAKYQEIAALFDKAMLRHRYTQNIDYEIWKKFLFISAMAALTTYYKKSMDQITKEHNSEFKELLNEIMTLAQRKSINLTNDDLQATLQQASKVIPNAKTSMQLDFERAKKSEIDSLLGYIVNSGRKFNLATPLMEKIYSTLQSQ